MKLFVVELSVEVVVVATGENAAIVAAHDAIDSRDLDIVSGLAVAQPMRYLPSNFALDAIPFGDGDQADPDRTIAQWIAMGAAPEYRVDP